MTQQFENDFRTQAQKAMDFIQMLARAARLSGDRRVRNALRVIAANPSDHETIQEVTQQVSTFLTTSPYFKRALRNRSPFGYIPQSVAHGPIVLGASYDVVLRRWVRVGLYPHELQQFMLICGRSGAGKTNLLYVIIDSLLRNDLHFWWVDFKRDGRHLLRVTEDLLVFNVDTIRFNPLRPPPGCDPAQWLNRFCDIFMSVFFSSSAHASKSLLLQIIDHLYRERGVYDGSGDYPDVHDLDALLNPANYARKPSSQDQQRMHVCRNKTLPMTRLLGDMLREPSDDLEGLLERNVIFELDGLTEEYRGFLISMLLTWVFTLRITNNRRGDLRQVFIFDEAKMVYSEDRAKPSSPITQLTSQAREFQTGIIVSDQMPSTLSEAIKANVFTTVCFNLSSMKDARAMAYTLGLDEQQKPFVLTRPVGQSIVRFADRWTAPFLMQTPMVAFGKDVSDAEVLTHMRAHWKSSGHSYNTTDSRRRSTNTSARYARCEEVQSLLTQAADGELTPTMIKLLESIRDDPYLTTAARYKSVDLSARKGTRAIEQLIVEGFINELTISTGAKGRSGKYFEFTSKAEGALGRQSLGKGKGGFTHRFWQHRIRRHYEDLGYRAVIEAYIDGKSVDVGVWKANQRIAIEVEMSAAHVSENIVKDLSAGWDEVLVAYADEAIGRRARQVLSMQRDTLEKGWYEKVAFIPLKDLLR